MPRGSKPGERRGGRQLGTPNKKTLLQNAVICASPSHSNASPLDFILGLMRYPKVSTELRIEMAAAAAPFVHAKPQAPPRKRTNPMDSNPIKCSPNFTVRMMEGTLSALEHYEDGGGALSPLDFLLSVMNDPDATPRQRIKAARVAARYTHVVVTPDKLPTVDEYGFAISRTLANAIKEDWSALKALGVSSKEAPRRGQVLARQAERDEFLNCPPGYSADRDLKRRDELSKKSRQSMAEETELAFVIARITASAAAFNRSPEGRARRRLADLKYRRDVANRERNRRAGLTRAEGQELDELVKQYEPKPPSPPDPIVESFQRDRELRRQQAPVGSDPELRDGRASSHVRGIERVQGSNRSRVAEPQGTRIPGTVNRLALQSSSCKCGVFSTRISLPRKRTNCNTSPDCIQRKSRD